MVIPMEPPPSAKALSRPMTRARARSIETEVTSLLNELPYEQHETWLLPQAEILCVLRYEECNLKDPREEGQAPMNADEETHQEEQPRLYSGRTSGHRSGHPAPEGTGASSEAAAVELQEPNIRHRWPGHPSEPW
jgi:hypothetical protein